MFRRALATATLLAAPFLVGAASLFPDVPASHPYAEDIEHLVREGIVHGNPDGRFYPERTVNRAEMLKMLYIAAGETPDATQTECFSDIERGAWYEPYVCDAAKNGFVEGYVDGNFRPAQTVNRVEALKMLFTVFGMPAPETETRHLMVRNLQDISSNAWYMPYLNAAYVEGVLPVTGMQATRFGPAEELSRGEAAAYIASAHRKDLHKKEVPEDTPRYEEPETTADIRDALFPFTESGRFEGRDPITYRFSLTEGKTVMKIDAKITGAVPSQMVCRLYLLRDDGFSEEYYLGTQEDSRCVLLVALRPGDYQLQIQPTADDAFFEVEAQETEGDGNDGFMEAISLPHNVPRTAWITQSDYYDWYTVTIERETDALLEVTSSRELRCIIYSPLDIDLFGFSGPECNEQYRFKPGTYTVGIGRMPPLGKSQDYTILLRVQR